MVLSLYMEHKQEQQKSETALREEEVLAFWNKQGVFEKSLTKKAPQGEFVFYDGPPFATGLPHWGSLLASVSKDVIGRYKTMRGFHVPRRWGWDCHGLPIENIVEKKLGITTKKEIETMGIDRFNEEARKSVLTYVHDWKKYVERVGRWVDFDHSYKTMDNTYIESVWWALKKIHEDGRLYEGRKVLMYCPRCETPLSKAEIAMDNSYKMDPADTVYVKFKLKAGQRIGDFEIDENTFILVWTTTPWTLPANTALAVGKDMEYSLVTDVYIDHPQETLEPSVFKEVFEKKEYYIFAQARYENLKKTFGNHDHEGRERKMRKFNGSDLVGLSYEPLYPIEKVSAQKNEKTHTILSADFVTTEEGTGVVHIAPVYGEDDYALGAEHNLPMVPLLDATGTYNQDAPAFIRDTYYKKGEKLIIDDLKKKDVLFGEPHRIEHSYPHCYRCGTALIYNALTSWFINIQKVKDRLLETNEEIAWYPEHLQHGRFGNSVASAPDWTISRNRFWASPLPIWKHEKTGEVQVFGSLAEVREHTKKSGNVYYTVRHGQAESNVQSVVSSDKNNPHHLTEQGKEQVRKAGEFLQGKGITKIVASPFVRTRETSGIIAEILGLTEEHIVYEERFGEWCLGEHNMRPLGEVRALLPTLADRFVQRANNTAETLAEMKRRVGGALYELEEKYQNETILIVTHEYTGWLLESVVGGKNLEETIALAETLRGTKEDIIANGEVRGLDFVPLSHNADYELDLHRPYIDELPLLAKDGARLLRIPEVVDCWVESGAMPFASEHYPMEHKEMVERRYPGDFISEYIAQTRTWFYYMHALGVLLFNAPSFTHCVTTGNLLASDGSKMSKSKNNYTDPLLDMDKYGADAARFYLLSSVVMQAEDSAFKEEELREAHNRFVNMLWNTYTFYTMYVSPASAPSSNFKLQTSNSVLDQWVSALLAKTVREVTEYMDAYDTVRASRALRDFVTDFSTWYVRRSRDRFKSEDVEDREHAKATTREVLLTLAKLSAPITPFIAESIYRGLEGEEESVHLAEWPEAGKEDSEVCEKMEATRKLVSEALELRAKAGVKVRQPLASLTIPNGVSVYTELIADEVNVKEIREGETLSLDTVLTPELILEGDVRELVRAVQALRKEKGFHPEDDIMLEIALPEALVPVLDSARDVLKRTAGVSSVETVDTLSEKSIVKCSQGELEIQIRLSAYHIYNK